MDPRKFVLVAISVALLLGLARSFEYRAEDLASEEKLWDLYERWRSHHTVSRSLTEKQTRFNVFKENVKHIHKVNQKDKPYKLKLNIFADMTNHEFVKHFGGSKVSHYRMLHGPRSKDNHGCDGGMMEQAFQFIEQVGGLTTETNYPYEAKDESCNSAKLNAAAVQIDGYEMVPENDENALMKAAANQPIAIAIDAGGKDLQFYSEGVFTGDCGTELNHGVALVGYGSTLDGTKYWIVKNSWGTEWGEQGFIRMQRGVDAEEGICGIAMDACYPVKSTSTNKKKQGSLAAGKDEL
ncbi:unnamed protein product [Linum tenue]|uniref:Vignain n=1 Tax=Linum tenue TaxID=586396 RepID=A0AAV0KUG4_9ROSI|nr:unnamed protein product [Linum tenue]